MREKIKKRFLDILFESDPDEETERPVKTEKKVKEDKKEARLNVRDLIYQHPTGSAFIDLDQKPKEQPVSEKKDAEYEFSSQISPIFGLIKENQPKKIYIDTEANDAIVKKPDDSHLDIPTSPIYGYSSKEEALDNDYDVRDILSDEKDTERYLREPDEFDDPAYYDDVYEDIGADDDDEINLFNSYGEKR